MKNNLHFLHPCLKCPAFTGDFGCRIGCRIPTVVSDTPTPSICFTHIFHPILRNKTVEESAVSCQKQGENVRKTQGKASKTAESYTESYTPNQILHPILHPKSPVNAGHLRHGCRKCRLFFINFWFCVNLGDRHVLAWLINLSDNQHIN